jgi:nucleotide-binding universal stress UspA family protein
VSERDSSSKFDPLIGSARKFEHLLVPLDGSTLAEAVLPSAFFIASQLQAMITLLHVLEHDPPEDVHGDPHLQNEDEADAYLQKVAAQAPAEVAAVNLHVHSNPEHDVPRSITEHASELGADLVLIATHGRGGLRGFFLGNVAQQVLHLGNQPVLLTKPGGVSFAGKQLAIPLDGTPGAEAALPVARMLASNLGASLFLASVVPTVRTLRGQSIAPATFSPTATAGVLELEAEERQIYLQEMINVLSSPTCSVSAVVRRGDVASELVATIRETETDLVVMCTHAKQGIEAFVTGSIAPRIVAHLQRPILLIRMPT